MLRPSRRVGVLSTISLGLMVAFASTGGAESTPLSCGTTVSASVVLTQDLIGCAGDGLVVFADDVTIDMNGHLLSGSGAGRGVFSRGERFTVRGGRIEGFDTGVSVFGQSSEITEMEISRNGNLGVFVESRADLTTLSDNKISKNTGAGVFVDAFARVPRVLRNNISSNGADGLDASFGADNARYEDNRFSKNGGYGLRIDTATSKVIGNTASDNAAAGIWVREIFPGFSQNYFIASNLADRNAGLGIEVPLNIFGESPRDGGGNAANLNGDPRQCLNIVCAANRGQAKKDAPDVLPSHPEG